MRRAVFRVFGRFDRSVNQQATVTIDRDLGVMAVRPLRRRREYYLPLSKVAEIVVAKIIKAELAERRAQRRRRR